MAATRLPCRLITVGRLSLNSWLKCSNMIVKDVCKRTVCTTNVFQFNCNGTYTAIHRNMTTPSTNNSRLMPQTKGLIRAHFCTFKKQNTQHINTKIGSFASGVRHLPTLNQIRRMKPRTKKTKPKRRIPDSKKVLLGPQRKGVCIKVFIRKPKKPNSAQRKCAVLKLSDGKTVLAYIPGEKAQLQEHGVVLFEGGRVQDCPGIKYKIIRGKLDMN